MRIATYNFENLFDRAKAMNLETRAAGRPALEAHQELNALIDKDSYSAADKKRMLTLLEEQGLLKKDDGPLLLIRKIRGKFLNRPKTGPVTVAADERADWIGWVEFVSEPVKEAATENTARVIQAQNPDILGVVEAEDRTALRLFNEQLMPAVGGDPYSHVMLIDGNDDRGIDVGIMTKSDFEIVAIRSHVDDTDEKGTVFSRDCAEYLVRLPSGNTLWVLMNHLKSKGFGSQKANDAKRLRQAKRIREIYDAHLAAGDEHVAILGDFNDTPDSAPLAPLLGGASAPQDVSAHSDFDDGGRPGTFGNGTKAQKIDYILLSPGLFAKMAKGGIERRGVWGGKNGTLFPHFDELKSEVDAASDHALVWADIEV